MARVRRWVDERNDELPPEAAKEMRYEMDIDSGAITLMECRPPWREEYGPEWTRSPIARLRYTKSRRVWTLYWQDRHLRFHIYDHVEPSANVEEQLAEVDADPTSIFWG